MESRLKEGLLYQIRNFWKTGFFDRVSLALNSVSVQRCRIYFRSTRRYMQLYKEGIQGQNMPEAMRLMRKQRKHRGGGLHPDDAIESQRGKNTHKKARISHLRSIMNWLFGLEAWSEKSRAPPQRSLGHVPSPSFQLGVDFLFSCFIP